MKKQSPPQAPKKLKKQSPPQAPKNFEKTKPAAGAEKIEKNKARRRRRKILKKTKPAAGAGKFKKTGLRLAQILYYLKSASGVLTAAGVFFWKNTPGEKNRRPPAPGFCSRIRAGKSIFPPVTSNLFDP